MPTPISLHHLGVDSGEGTIVAWHVEEGADVDAGTLLAEVETSKASHEIEAPVSGTLARIDAAVGSQWPLDAPIGWLLEEGESADELPGAAEAGT